MSKKALFITIKELKQKSIIDGQVDADKLIQFIEVAQDVHIQQYLGTNLYDKFQTLIITNTLNDVINSDYKTLLEDYIKPMLIWFTQSSYLPFAMYQINNGGIFKHVSESSQTISLSESNALLSKVNDTASFYTRRFEDYMNFNFAKYPEYCSAENGKMYPNRNINFTSRVL